MRRVHLASAISSNRLSRGCGVAGTHQVSGLQSSHVCFFLAQAFGAVRSRALSDEVAGCEQIGKRGRYRRQAGSAARTERCHCVPRPATAYAAVDNGKLPYLKIVRGLSASRDCFQSATLHAGPLAHELWQASKLSLSSNLSKANMSQLLCLEKVCWEY